VNTLYFKFDVEVVDNESRYRQNRMQAKPILNDSIIRSPMPGKVVKVYVKKGDQVKEGEIVENNQLLVVIEEVSEKKKRKEALHQIINCKL